MVWRSALDEVSSRRRVDARVAAPGPDGGVPASVAVGAARWPVLAGISGGLAVAALWIGSGVVAMTGRLGGGRLEWERCGSDVLLAQWTAVGLLLLGLICPPRPRVASRLPSLLRCWYAGAAALGCGGLALLFPQRRNDELDGQALWLLGCCVLAAALHALAVRVVGL